MLFTNALSTQSAILALPLVNGVMTFVKNEANKLTVNIMDEGIEGLFKPINEALNSIGDWMNSVVLSLHLAPSMATWNQYLGAETGKDLQEGCQLFGAMLTILLLIYYIIQYIANPEKQRVTPIRTLGRTAVAAFFIYGVEQIYLEFLKMMARFNQLVLTSAGQEIQFGHLLLGTAANSTTGLTVFGFNLVAFATPPLSSVALVFVIIISWQLLKQYVRCLLELIERYLILIIILFFMPAAAGTLVYEGTENIFKSYWRMVFGQAFLLMFGGVMLKGATYLIIQQIALTDLLGFLFTLGYLKTIQRVDSYLQAMGLNIANSIGGLAQSLQGGGRSLIGGLSNLNSMRRGAGGVMQAFGAAKDNKGLFKAGAILGANARDMAISGLPTESNLNKRFASMSAAIGNEASVGGAAASRMLSSYMSNPRENMRAIGALDQNSLCAGVSALTGIDDVNNVKMLQNGSLAFGYGDDNNAILSKTDSGIGKEIKTADGKETIGYLNGESSLDSGDTFNGTYNECVTKAGALGLADHADITPEQAASITSVTSDGKYTSFADDTGTVVAQVDKKNAYVSARLDNEQLPEAKQAELVSLAKKNYPNWQMTDQVKYDKEKNAHYIESQKHSQSDKHRLYIQDGVSRNTYMPQKDSAMEMKSIALKRQSTRKGTSRKERIHMGFEKAPILTEKK